MNMNLNHSPAFKIRCRGCESIPGLVGTKYVDDAVKSGLLSQSDGVRIKALNPGERFEDADGDTWIRVRAA